MRKLFGFLVIGFYFTLSSIAFSDTQFVDRASPSVEDVTEVKAWRKFETSLREVKGNYEKLVLNGQPDPYIKMMKSGMPAIAGPSGSELLAMVRVKSSDNSYGVHANKVMHNNQLLFREIESKVLSPGDKLIQDSKTTNPYVIRKDGTKIKLQWHHSPNHIMSVSLIPRKLHLGKSIFGKLHIGGKGGNELYNIKKLLKSKKQSLTAELKGKKAKASNNSADVKSMKRTISSSEIQARRTRGAIAVQ